MDVLCESCLNVDCKNCGEQFMSEKLPVCKVMIELSENGDFDDFEPEFPWD